MKPIHTIIHALNECYPFVLMAVFIVAFLVAFAMMFIMPQISLLLLFVGLYTLALAVGLGKMSRMVERRIALALLDRGVCPHCGHAAARPFTSPCPSCQTNYESHPAAGLGLTALHGASAASNGFGASGGAAI